MFGFLLGYFKGPDSVCGPRDDGGGLGTCRQQFGERRQENVLILLTLVECVPGAEVGSKFSIGGGQAGREQGVLSVGTGGQMVTFLDPTQDIQLGREAVSLFYQ